MVEFLVALILAQEGRDPLEILASLETNLRKGLRPNVDRLALRAEAESAFNKEIAKAKVKSPKLIWEHYNDYLLQMDATKRSFFARDHRPERVVWIDACRTALLKVATQARIPDEAPSTGELFNACFDAVIRARQKISGEDVDDLRSSAYESVNVIFRGQVRRCRPPKGDPRALYKTQISQIDLRFGKSPDLPDRMLRDIAKACLDKDVTALR